MEIQNAILQTIENMVEERLKSIGCNYYKTGIIKSISGSDYIVTINSEDSIFKARAGLTLAVGNIVYICCPNGNYSLSFIDLIRPI